MKNTRPALIALTAALALGISACGASDDPADSDETTSTTTTSETSASGDDATETTTSDQTTGTSSPSDPGGADETGLQAVLDAIEAAEKETGGTVYEVDDQDDDGSWEIDVAKGNQSIEVEVDADGRATTDDDDDLDDDDRAGLDAAEITVGDAIEAALEEVDGTFADAELAEEDGNHHWEVSIDTEDRDEVEVHVDVSDGTATVEDDRDDEGDDGDDD